MTPWVVAMTDVWVSPIRLDPNWNGGDYYGRAAPVAGISTALKIVTLTARHWGWQGRVFNLDPADPTRPTAAAIENRYRVQAAYDAVGGARASLVDANHFLYTARANELYRLTEAEVAGIRARILFVPAASDLLFPPELSQRALERFKSLGGRGEIFVLRGDGGHLDGLFEITQASDAISAFLASE
jgi:homoserine O-acetyltransferase